MLKSQVIGIFILIHIVSGLQIDDVQDPDAEYVPRVVNGRPAALGDVPYQIAFKSRSRGSMYRTFCGGILISDKKLVSAAHCFEEMSFSPCFKGTVSKSHLSRVKAVAGNLNNYGYISYSDSETNGQWRGIRNMFYPRTYKFPRNDICVGNTKHPFTINNFVKPIAFTRRFAEYKGTCLVSGFGRVSRYKGSDRLLLADLHIVPTRECNRKHRRNMVKFVCTDIYLTDVGKGDSGGPLVCSGTGDPDEDPVKGILVGVVSGSRIGVGSFFTRVSSFKKFIDNSSSKPRGLLYLVIINAYRLLFLFCFNMHKT